MKNSSIKILEIHGRCPLDYGKVRYEGGSKDGSVFTCKSCGARLEKQHVMAGRNSEDRVDGKSQYFVI